MKKRVGYIQYADTIHLSEQVHLADLWNITGNSQK